MSSLPSTGLVTHVKSKPISQLVEEGIARYPLKYSPSDIERVANKEAYEIVVQIHIEGPTPRKIEIRESMDLFSAIFPNADTDSARLLEYIGKPDADPLELKGEYIPVRTSPETGYTIQTDDLDELERWKLENGHLEWEETEGYVNKFHWIPTKYLSIIIAVSIPISYGLISLLLAYTLQPFTEFAEEIAMVFLALGILPILDLTVETYKTSIRWLTSKRAFR